MTDNASVSKKEILYPDSKVLVLAKTKVHIHHKSFSVIIANHQAL